MYPRKLDQNEPHFMVQLPDKIMEVLKSEWCTVKTIKEYFKKFYDEVPTSGTIIRMLDNSYSVAQTDDHPAKYKIVTEEDWMNNNNEGKNA